MAATTPPSAATRGSGRRLGVLRNMKGDPASLMAPQCSTEALQAPDRPARL